MGNHPSDFLKKANPSTVPAMAREPENCLFGNYPTLSETEAVYGSDTVRQWLSAQLTGASAFCGARNMTVGQINTLSVLIAQEFYFLRITEIMLFIYKWMTGKFGEQYGNVDPQSIMRALSRFVYEDRALAYEQRDKEQQRQQREEAARNAVPMPDDVKKRLDAVVRRMSMRKTIKK